MPDRKKRFIELPKVTAFIGGQSKDIQAEYGEIVDRLEIDGRLVMPYGEKIEGENLFAIRVIRAGNIRVFYVYGNEDKVYGLSGYVKKTQDIPEHEMKKAQKLVKQLRRGGWIK